MKKLYVVCLLGMVISLNMMGQHKETAAAIKGTWNYTAKEAPWEYQEGKVIFFEEDGDFKVKIDIDGYVIEGESLKIEKNEIKFNTSIDYELVRITLNLKEGKLSGKAETYEGIIPVELEKQKS